MSDARDELLQRAATRGHRADAERYFAERDSGQPVEMTDEQLADAADAPRVLGTAITNADGLRFWMGSYNQTAATVPDYAAVSVWPVDR